jgi:hypothetical protein
MIENLSQRFHLTRVASDPKLEKFKTCRGSSLVERRPEKAGVASSILAPGTTDTATPPFSNFPKLRSARHPVSACFALMLGEGRRSSALKTFKVQGIEVVSFSEQLDTTLEPPSRIARQPGKTPRIPSRWWLRRSGD